MREVGGGAGATTAWVIESDCPLTDGVRKRFPGIDVARTSMYLVSPAIIEAWKKSGDALRNTIALDPAAADPQVANLGIRFPLADGWTERAADTAFLTAVAPGNPVFSIYYPHNVGVFSMFDDLAGIDSGTLSYLVVGWYANPDDDVLASWPKDSTSEDPYGALLDRLGWTVAGDPDVKAERSLYEGMALTVAWQRDGNPPPDDPLEAVRDSGRLNVSIGNNTIDAFTALVGEQLQAAGHPTQTVKLLRTFLYDLLPVVNEVNGDALLEEAVRKEWFGSEPGGYRWEIVARSSDGSAGVDLTPAEATWLTQLNRDQDALDSALRALFELQWRFNATWWKLGLDPDNLFPEPPPGVTNAKLRAYLDPANADGITAALLAQYRTVTDGLGKVPQPVFDGTEDPQAAFQKGIQAFAQARGLGDGKELKAVAAPRFRAATNPVVVLSGVEPAPASDPDESLVVRTVGDLVAGFTFGGRTADAAAVSGSLPKLPNVAALPPEVPALLAEFFFLDPANAAAIAAAIGAAPDDVAAAVRARSKDSYAAPLPAYGLDAWTQPWNPMYVEWKVRYTHIPYETAGRRNWTFDGTDYRYSPGAGGGGAEDREVGGISLLSPHAQFVFGTRLKEFLNKYPNADLGQLEQWIAQIDDWKFLAQELTGLNELLALRDPRTFRRPGAADTVGAATQQYSAADLAGFPTDQPPGGTVVPGAFQGAVDSVPYLPNGPRLTFHGVRQGQLYFEELAVYDKFGRRLRVIESSGGSGLFDAKNFPLVRDAALLPDTVVHSEIAAVAQLPPRTLQHARLDFRLADGRDDAKILGLDDGVNPIAGWVLPNHLDRSLLLYGPDGASLGEYRLVVGEDGTKHGEWQPPPHSDVATLDDVGQVAPRLQSMLEADTLGRQADFEAFLQAIDATLWTIDPLGARHDQNLSVLVGRPLALVRARLALRPRGPALRDTGWSATFDPPAPGFLEYRFGVRLGDRPTRQDGVIGYYLGDDYGTFNSVAAPETTASQSYVRQIGPVGAEGGGNYIELQFDDSSSAYVTVLADPRAALHAVTGILPIKRVEIPAGFVQRALGGIEIGFRLGPVLTSVGPTPAQGGATPAHPNAIGLPTPAEQNGSWSWWEREAGPTPGWTGYDLVGTTPNARLRSIPSTLREGILQLAIDLNEKA